MNLFWLLFPKAFVIWQILLWNIYAFLRILVRIILYLPEYTTILFLEAQIYVTFFLFSFNIEFDFPQ
jgi:hypothetical protein